MRRAAKTDANHAEIRDFVRKLGAYWLDMFQLKNCCDGVVVYKGEVVAVEVKDGSKPPSKRHLTDGEREFAAAWTAAGGKFAVIESTRQVVDLVNQMNARSLARPDN